MVALNVQKYAQKKLAEAGIESALFEARQIAAFLGNTSEEELDAVLKRRIDGEPLQYILGEWEFYDLPFYVGEGVLIPRPDTETLAEFAIDRAGTRETVCMDLCSGSGCLAITLDKHSVNATVYAMELSDKAFEYLKKNIERNASSVRAVKGDVLEDDFGEFDLIISNPPFIKTADLDTLQKEVKREPQMALDGGDDGLVFYRKIAEKWVPHLKSGGTLAVEIGIGQGDDVKAIFKAAGLKNIGSRNDLSGIERVIFGTLD
ncbi:MAG: peptide chain release factor N(5)-glutamine methyltransferase [Clostridia bacterium]|nr:peptide chain release factor N(5)-glutamine methyltransferase [Clostridia bacterium]